MAEQTDTVIPVENEIQLASTKKIKMPMRKRMEWVKLIAATLVPIMIAVFTLVTTIQQLSSEKATRLKDLYIAYEERSKDLYLADEHRYQVVFDTMIKEISPLIEQTDNLSASQQLLAESRLHTVFTQLDGARKGDLIEFLYDGGLIRRDKRGKILSLAGVNLDNIRFRSRSGSLDLHYTSFESASLRNASFIDIGLAHANFYGCVLTGARFIQAFLTQASFVDAILRQTDFTQASTLYTVFSGADMTGAIVPDDVLFGYENLYNDVIFPNGTHQATISPENLIFKNPDAEQDPCVPSNSSSMISEWLTYGDDITTVPYGVSDSPFNMVVNSNQHGNCYFWGRARNSVGKVITMEYRSIDLLSFRYLIDAGRAICRLSAWLGGVDSREDYVEVRLLWIKYPVVLATMKLGRVTAKDRNNTTQLQQRTLVATVPRSTQIAVIEVDFHTFNNDQNEYGSAVVDTFEFYMMTAD